MRVAEVKVMIISDLHYDKRVFHGIDESKAWEGLLNIVDYHRPDLLISLGDWGKAINEAEFYELLKRVRFGVSTATTRTWTPSERCATFLQISTSLFY